MTRLILSLTLGMALLSGCVSETVKSTSVPVLDTPTTLAPEAELLDVGVVILDPGISAEEDEDLVYPEVRKAEATFMATELAEVLAEQGGWGAVRVVPDDRQFSDLLVRGTILGSDGESLELKILVSDARGKLWLDKRYQGVTSRYAYEQGTRVKQDPFLAVYRMIANDMLEIFEGSRPRIGSPFDVWPRCALRGTSRTARLLIISMRMRPVRSACVDCRQKMTPC